MRANRILLEGRIVGGRPDFVRILCCVFCGSETEEIVVDRDSLGLFVKRVPGDTL